jgi:hypothetical protein
LVAIRRRKSQDVDMSDEAVARRAAITAEYRAKTTAALLQMSGGARKKPLEQTILHIDRFTDHERAVLHEYGGLVDSAILADHLRRSERQIIVFVEAMIAKRRRKAA